MRIIISTQITTVCLLIVFIKFAVSRKVQVNIFVPGEIITLPVRTHDRVGVQAD